MGTSRRIKTKVTLHGNVRQKAEALADRNDQSLSEFIECLLADEIRRKGGVDPYSPEKIDGGKSTSATLGTPPDPVIRAPTVGPAASETPESVAAQARRDDRARTPGKGLRLKS